MGQAKLRGTRDQRAATAMAKAEVDAQRRSDTHAATAANTHKRFGTAILQKLNTMPATPLPMYKPTPPHPPVIEEPTG